VGVGAAAHAPGKAGRIDPVSSASFLPGVSVRHGGILEAVVADRIRSRLFAGSRE